MTAAGSMLARLRSVAAVLLGAACAEGANSTQRATVFAAASLTAPFQALAAAFARQQPGRAVDLHFAGTPQLAMQVREGAPVDVFASADEPNMQRVLASGRAVAVPVTFATNRLTIVTEKGNPRHIAALLDLARPDLRVLLCGPEVPAGRYARQALAKAGVHVDSVSDEPSVQAVVSKVALGEVDAGIVYVTDARAAAERVGAVPIDPTHDVVATYPIVALDAGRAGATGAAFVAFVVSPDGQAILRSFGFGDP